MTFQLRDHHIRRVFYAALAIELSLILIDYCLNYSRWVPFSPLRRLFNMARDNGIAGWVATIQSFLVGITVLFIAIPALLKNRWVGRGWLLISAFFVYMSADDASKIHERFGSSFKKMSREIAEQYPSYSWQISTGPLFVLMGVFILIFLWKQFQKEPRLRMMYIAALSCFGFALIMDFGEGYDGAFRMISHKTGWAEGHVSHYSRVIEEFLELLGNTAFLIAFLSYLKKTGDQFTLKFSDS